MEQLPRFDGPAVGECSVEQAIRGTPGRGPFVSAGPPPRARRPLRRSRNACRSVDSTNRYLADLVRAGVAAGSAASRGLRRRGRAAKRGPRPARQEVGGACGQRCALLDPVPARARHRDSSTSPPGLWRSQRRRHAARPPASSSRSSGRTTCWPASAKLAGHPLRDRGCRPDMPPRPDAPGRPPAVVVGLGLNLNWPSAVASRGRKGPRARLHRGPWRGPQPCGRATRSTANELTAGCCARPAGGTRSWRASRDGSALPPPTAVPARRSGGRSAWSWPTRQSSAQPWTSTTPGCLLVSTGTCLRTIAAGDVVHVR